MNEVQRKSFELLKIFVDICEKWDIPYYMVCGSALGAVKYEGFIPWDDDIDVGLLREDYMRFLEVAPQELPDWCFLQNYKTERAFPHSFSKLRNSNTAFIEESIANLPMNHGIYLDVFPIDGYPAGWGKRFRFSVMRRWNDWIRFSVIENPGRRQERIRNRVMRVFGFHKKIFQANERLEKLYCSCSPKESEIWCNFGNWQGKLEYAPKWHYGNGAWATFEGLRVRIPENIDAYLTQKYGDWRSDPPAEKQRSHHVNIVADPDRSYKNYV